MAGRRRVVTAGAEWLQAYGHAWVRTYELVEVKLKARGAAMDLCLKDTAGRTLEMELRFVENNPLLWDLVYNGILHSVHIRPVETNRAARGRLQLPRARPGGASRMPPPRTTHPDSRRRS